MFFDFDIRHPCIAGQELEKRALTTNDTRNNFSILSSYVKVNSLLAFYTCNHQVARVGHFSYKNTKHSFTWFPSMKRQHSFDNQKQRLTFFLRQLYILLIPYLSVVDARSDPFINMIYSEIHDWIVFRDWHCSPSLNTFREPCNTTVEVMTTKILTVIKRQEKLPTKHSGINVLYLELTTKLSPVRSPLPGEFWTCFKVFTYKFDHEYCIKKVHFQRIYIS